VGHSSAAIKVKGKDKIVVWGGDATFDETLHDPKQNLYSRVVRSEISNRILAYDIESNTWDHVKFTGGYVFPYKRWKSSLIALNDTKLVMMGGEMRQRKLNLYGDAWTLDVVVDKCS